MTPPTWIDISEALAIHEMLLSDHGGAAGLRDVGRLDSALARARQRHAREDTDLCVLAAAYISGIIRDHPFTDGNKRTGFVVGALFLELNEYFLGATEADATRAVLDLAAGDLGEEEFASWLRSNGRPV